MSVTAFDETLTTADGDIVGFMLAPGNQGFSSTSNPFAVKATQGDRSYSDYDAQQALAMSDLSGGIGQDRLIVPTKYWTGRNVDTRGKRVILGPEQHMIGTANLDTNVAAGLEAGTVDWHYIYSTARQALAAPVNVSANTSADHLMIYLRATVDAGTITVSLYSDDEGVPGTEIDSYTVSREDYDARGKWVKVTPAATVELSSDGTYWVVVAHSGTTTTAVAWGVVEDPTEAVIAGIAKVYDGSSWASDGCWPVLWIESATVTPDTMPTFLTGAGEDGINRMWMWAGRRLYYISGAGAIVPVAITTEPYEFPNEITDVCFYKGTGDSHRYLYVALGGTDMVKFDCNITGTPTMSSVTSSKATRLCVHDNKLWRYYSGAVQYSTDGSTWAGSGGEIGDSSYTARRMVSWDGALWIGCDDGLFKCTYATTTLTVVRQVDLTAQASPNNFSFMTVHQADLWFSLGEGIIRYTNGDVVVPMTPSTGADQEDEERFVFRAAYSTLTTLFVVGIGSANNYTSILAYVEAGWHPLVTFARMGDDCISLAVDPSLYGPIPRLWFSSGLQVGYVKMPTMGQLRWTYDVDYAAEGELVTSWFDGNLMTIEKDWSAIEVDAERVGSGAAPNIEVYYRTQEDGAWTLAGTVTDVGYTAMALTDTASHSTKIQLKVVLNRGTWLSQDDTPHLLGLVIRYLERPAIIHTHTRTYRLGPHTRNRVGTEVQRSLVDQIADLRALASEAEALTWRTWYGATYQVAIMMYNATEIRNEVGGQDVGYVLVSVRLQEV